MADERRTYDDKLALILRRAAAVFAEKGYHQASIRDISRATGVSLSGLYYYVESKEELLFLIQDHCFGTVLEKVERLLAGIENPEARLRAFIDNHIRFFVGNMKEMKVLSHEAEWLTGEYRRVVSAKKKRYTELCMSVLKDVQAPATAVDVRVSTYALFGMMNWIYNWYRPGRDVPVAELAEGLCQLFLRGYRGGGPEAVRGSAVEQKAGDSSHSIWRR